MDRKNIGITATEYPGTSLEDIFIAAQEFGVGCIELIVPKNMSGKDVHRVIELTGKYSIGISCITPEVELNLPGLDIKEEQKKIFEAISIAAQLKVDYVCTYTGGNSERSFDQAIEEYVHNITPCVKEAETKGITIVMENEFNFAGSDPTETPEGCLEIIKAVNSPHFRINFDVCNFYFAGIEAFPYSYEIVKDYIAYIHLKNGVRYIDGLHPPGARIFEELSSHGKYICVPLREGAINFEAFLSRLKADGYDGYLIVEPHTEEARREEVFSTSIEYLRKRIEQ